MGRQMHWEGSSMQLDSKCGLQDAVQLPVSDVSVQLAPSKANPDSKCAMTRPVHSAEHKPPVPHIATERPVRSRPCEYTLPSVNTSPLFATRNLIWPRNGPAAMWSPLVLDATRAWPLELVARTPMLFVLLPRVPTESVEIPMTPKAAPV